MIVDISSFCLGGRCRHFLGLVDSVVAGTGRLMWRVPWSALDASNAN